MDTQGALSPEALEEAQAVYEAAGPTAQQVVRETAKAMAFDREEYRERVTSEVIERARNVLFAERLSVTVGSRAAFEEWREAHPTYDVELQGSDNVERLAWHSAPFAETVVAVTFQNEPEAAIGTVRRQAFGRIYRPRFEDDAEASDGPGTESENGGDE
ncbi:MAG: DUF5809 family protein [Halobellus sp.]|uniref:DUF5809 family protein n=1 Tax=Halobellus sp. TaxID=1979212 RepID=UPI0035D502CB